MKINDALNTLIHEKMAEHHVPGVVVGVLHNGEQHIHSFGVTNIDHPLDVTADTIFQIGSNTKTMTATVMMMLAEQGLLDWSAPVKTYIPEFAVSDDGATRMATVRHLVTHTAGWVGDHFISTGSGADASERYVKSMTDLGQLAPFGTLFSYNNAAFATAGLLIERVTGKSYWQVMDELLFKPLGMSNSFLDHADVMLRRFAVGHHVDATGNVNVGSPYPLPLAMHAAGAVACSAEDLLTYAQFYLDGGVSAENERLISAENIAAMWSPQAQVDSDMGNAVGYSWFINNEAGIMTYRHGGATVGQMSAFKVVPSKDFAFCIFTNSMGGGQLYQAVEKWLLEEYCDIVAAELEIGEIGAELSAELAGTYRRPMIEITLTEENGQLIANRKTLQGFPAKDSPLPPPTPPFPLGILPNGNLIALNGPLKNAQIQILRNTNGSIGYLRAGSRIHPRI